MGTQIHIDNYWGTGCKSDIRNDPTTTFQCTGGWYTFKKQLRELINASWERWTPASTDIPHVVSVGIYGMPQWP